MFYEYEYLEDVVCFSYFCPYRASHWGPKVSSSRKEDTKQDSQQLKLQKQQKHFTV